MKAFDLKIRSGISCSSDIIIAPEVSTLVELVIAEDDETCAKLLGKERSMVTPVLQDVIPGQLGFWAFLRRGRSPTFLVKTQLKEKEFVQTVEPSKVPTEVREYLSQVIANSNEEN